MIPIRGIDHVVLRVRDLDRMVAFYRDALGCEVVWTRPDLGMVHVRAGDALIDLVTHDGPVGGSARGAPTRDGHNMGHLCLRVDPFDTAAIVAHLAAHAVEAGEVRERFGAGGVGPSIYLDDPEGNTVELKGPAHAWPAAARRPR
ncbi:MAG: VOC family protein [Burkholderiales bacterium]|nr:VOC family protein [Burkholderiales bacterium]